MNQKQLIGTMHEALISAKDALTLANIAGFKVAIQLAKVKQAIEAVEAVEGEEQ